MPSELREHQHEISNVDGTEGFVFGTEDTGYLTLAPPVMEGAEITPGDRGRPQEDGRMFGRDLRGAKSVVFEIGVLTNHLSNDAHRANLDYLDRLEGLWTDDRWRYDPNAMAMLRTHIAGQTWRAYGRPRRYEEAANGVMTQLGYTPIVADFPMVDASWYSDTESRVEVRLNAGSSGGLLAPLKAPMSTVQATEGSNSIIVGGSKPTWPVVEFHGPITNPEVIFGNGLVIGLRRTLAAGEVVVYDPRPWVRAVYRLSDGAGMPGSLSGRTPRMADARVRPGGHSLTYIGVDSTGSSKCVVRWRNARSRP